MLLDLRNLKVNERIIYDEDLQIDETVYHHDEIKGLKKLHVKGFIYFNSMEILEINLELSGIMNLVDSVSLELLEHEFQTKIEEEYDLNDAYFKEYYEKEQNILDIMAILWENIVLEVPISFTKTSDMCLSGDGWSLGREEKVKDEIDPRLSKLAELLDNRKE